VNSQLIVSVFLGKIQNRALFSRTELPQAVTSTAYNAAIHQTTFLDKTLTYDNNGNLSRHGVKSLLLI
jgi:hypothetical protein